MYLKVYQPFFEGIRQDVGVVYHRTGRKALRYAFQNLGISNPPPYPYTDEELLDQAQKYLMPAIAKFGLMVSPGMYGPPAVYNTYELKSQLNSKMVSAYGEFIVKSQTKLSHVLIFDKDQAMKTFGPKMYSIYDQLSLYGIPKSDLMKLLKDKTLQTSIQNYEADPKNRFSADVAYELSKQPDFAGWVKSGIVKGLVYTGSNDGKCLIVYNHDLLIPKAYARADDSKLLSKWTLFQEVKEIQKDYEKMKGAKLEIQKQHKSAYDLNDPDIIKSRKLIAAIDKGDAKAILEMLQLKYISPFAYWNGQPFYFIMIDKIDDEKVFDYIHQNYDFNPNLKEKVSGKTPIHLAMESNHEGTFQSLLKIRHISFNIHDKSGWPILQSAIVLAARDPKKYLKYFKWIVEDRRVNVNYPTKDKRSPLDIIKEAQKNNTNNQEVIKEMELMLIKKGAK